jgi:hypothetical protein
MRAVLTVELRVMDTDGSVLRVVEGVKSEPGAPKLAHTRLRLGLHQQRATRRHRRQFHGL